MPLRPVPGVVMPPLVGLGWAGLRPPRGRELGLPNAWELGWWHWPGDTSVVSLGGLVNLLMLGGRAAGDSRVPRLSAGTRCAHPCPLLCSCNGGADFWCLQQLPGVYPGGSWPIAWGLSPSPWSGPSCGAPGSPPAPAGPTAAGAGLRDGPRSGAQDRGVWMGDLGSRGREMVVLACG